MLNDYEILRNENKKDWFQQMTSILKLLSASLAIYCLILMFPNFYDKIYETRKNMVDDSFNIRVIANSNTTKDQKIKSEIVENIQPIIAEIQRDVDNDEIFEKLSTYIQKNYAQYDVKIHKGEHLTPPKLVENNFYPQAYYNTLVLTIGAGRGDNFWCSVFANLCERPSEKNEELQEDNQETEVKFIIWEWLKGLFS